MWENEISNPVYQGSISFKDFISFSIMIPKLKRIQSSIDANMVSKELSKN